MDAAKLSLKRVSLSVAFALLMPAAAYSQQLSPSITSITIVGANPIVETVSSTTSTAITFSATASYTSGDPQWLCLSSGLTSSPTTLTGLITTAQFSVSVACSGTNLGLFTGTHNATITLAATGVTSVVIPVTYTVGSGGGGGTGAVTATPSSVNVTVGYGGTTSAIVTLNTSSSTPINFSLASPPVTWVSSWYQSSGNSGLVSSNQPAQLTIAFNGAGQAETSLVTTLTVNAATGSVSIPVTLNNGVIGSGGNGGTGSLSVFPATLAWSYSASSPGTFPSSTTVTMSSTNGGIGYSATATSSNGWLLVNNGYTASGTVGSTPLTIAPSTNLAALTPGTYTGTVAITGSDGSSGQVSVTATITGSNSGALTISPSPIPLSAAVNGSQTSATVSITSAVSGTLTATVTGSGISVSGSGENVIAGAATNIVIFGNPSGLANGTYVGTLNISVAGNTAGAQINFVVGTGGSTGGGTTAAATPAQLNFYYEPNTNMQVSQSQQVYLAGSGNFNVTSSTASSSFNWLSASVTSNALPTTIYVTANASNLASGTYSGQITVTNTSSGQTSVINVTLLVQGITTIYASPGDAVFNYIANVTSTTQQNVIEIYASDGSVVPTSATVSNSSNTPWLTVSGGGNTPTPLTVTTNAGNLANGVYSGNIIVTSSDNTVNVPIVLTVAGSSISSGTGPLTLGASSLSLQAQVNGSAVAQTVSVSASTNTTFTVSSSGSSNGITWLSVSPFGTTSTPTNITVTASPAGLTVGTYSGSITLVSNGVTQTLPVTFAVTTTGSGTTGTVVVTANGTSSTSPSLTFTATSAGATVPSQYLSVTSASGQSAVTFQVTATTTSGGSWIQLATSAGTQYQTPLNALTVTVNPTGLAGGTYTGAVNIFPVGGAEVTVPVTLTVSGGAGITVASTALSFSYQAGGATPATQAIAVTLASGTSASFTATAATTTPSGGSWLSVSPTTGTAPASLTVTATPTGLAAGTYTGTITVAGVSGATGGATVNVTLTVTVPLPTITAVDNDASFVSQPISPGEVIAIFGTNIGPATPLSFTLTSVGGVSTVPSSGLGGVTVSVNGYPAPILYVSATQINAIVPYEVAGIQRPSVLVTFLGQSSNGYPVTGASTAPGIFTANSSGTGPGAILNSDNSPNTPSNPAARGTVVQVYLTGEGLIVPAVDGKVTPASGPYPAPLLPITITVGGQPANYQFAGEAPGLVSGVLQLNVIIPPATSLSTVGNVPLVVSIGSVSSQAGVTVSIK